jgi:tetratricopeptide (TPR) repeat protein
MRARLVTIALTVTVSLGATVGAGVALVVAGGALGRNQRAAPDSSSVSSTVDLLDLSISRSQERLRRVPGDWETWASLGMSYLERARISSDPTYYPKADQAVQHSLQVRADGNYQALIALGALANARHDFATGRERALAAIELNAYSAEAFAVLADAETQLGHPQAATDALQRVLDLRPALSGYARASYDLEQRGLVAEATDLMRRALNIAVDRYDIAFCRNQLGDLALNMGDAATAQTEYTAGLAADPTSVTLLRGQARLAAMTGRVDDALGGYATITRRTPTPSYLLEYTELLQATGRGAEAQTQLRLATAAHQLFTANGGIDGLTGAAIAEANGDFPAALAEARAEWSRRQFVDVADSLGWALHLSNQDSEALGYASRAFATGARSATYAYHLGMIELALGDRAAARTRLSLALQLNPRFSPLDAPLARTALAGLESS